MSLFFLDTDEMWFPVFNEMSGDIVATGADLTTDRLILAYSQGIFPWYNEPGEIRWWCPEERAVLFLKDLHISHSMKSVLRNGGFRWTMDQAFERVMEGCRSGSRAGDTWILDEVVEAYVALHERGFAHSVEVWHDDQLVGGLYGVSLGKVFFGESMFSQMSNASKFGFINLCLFLREKKWEIIDCQVQNSYLETFGVSVIERELFLKLLKRRVKCPSIQGNWGDPKVWLNPVKTPRPQ